MRDYFIKKAEKYPPKLAFGDKYIGKFNEWKSQLLGELKMLLGPMPKAVALEPEVISEIHSDGLMKRRVKISLEEDMDAEVLLFVPENAMKKPAAAILCNHGHGRFGKDSVMGIQNSNDPEREAEIKRTNYDYGLQMAKRGYVTLAIDWRGFGERSDAFVHMGSDKCDVHNNTANLLGFTLLGLNIFDGMRCIDYLCSLDFVDKNRIGAMGLSFGGTMTTWLSLMDERIKAADIICYSCCFADFAIKRVNFCGSQFVPGLFRICDISDLQGLIAPRPLLAEIGLNDECFTIHESSKCSQQVLKIYEASNAANKYELDLFDGAHQFAGNKAFDFFDKYLGK